ncbi:MAG: O-antigen polymerase [Acidobacteriota bacterium]
MTMQPQQQAELRSTLRYESWCAWLAAVGLTIAAVWPAAAAATAVVSFALFASVLSRYRLRVLTNVAFLFLAITLMIVVTGTNLWTASVAAMGLKTTALHAIDSYTRAWSIQYVSMAIDAIAIGACCVQMRRHRLVKADFILRKPIQLPSIYLTAAFLPLLLSLVLFATRLRGLGYEGIQAVSQGSYKPVILLVLLTHAAFLRLFGGWASLGRTSRLFFGMAICLFLFIYVFLLSTRTNIFVFGMYLYYFYGWRIRWKTKMAAAAVLLALFSWIANYRSISYGGLEVTGIEGIAEGASIGPEFMLDMVHWAYEGVQEKGPTWGLTSLVAAVSRQNPADTYVQQKLPSYADAGGGFGFFYVAELVMDFGYVGGLVAAVLLGYALQKVSTMESEMARLTVLPALLGFSFPLLRNVFLMTLKSPLYVVVFCIVLDRIAHYGCRLREHIEVAAMTAVAE